MSFSVKDNSLLRIILFIIAFGLLIGSGSLYRWIYSYDLIMFITILVMAGVVFYQIFIPVHKNELTSNGYYINLPGLILVMFFISFPIMSDVINQVKSYEITYFSMIILMVTFLLGVKHRERILSYYLKLIVIFSFISLFYFFTDLLSELPSFVPYYGIALPQWSHFYYVWSTPSTVMLVIRNQSIFWEPGAFGFHLIVATLLAYKAKNNFFITILIIACLTTMSTTVYLFLFLLVLYQLFLSNNKIRFFGFMIFGTVSVLVAIQYIFGNLDIPLYLIKIIPDKIFTSGAGYASMQERMLYTVESLKLFLDNIFLGAGHYATNTELKNIGSETSALAGLLAELGIYGVFSILLYIRFFKHFKILSIPIALIWLNGEFMQYTPIALFILTHMVDDFAQNLFPSQSKSLLSNSQYY